MTGQGATLRGMNDDTGVSLAKWQKAIRAHGIDPDAVEPNAPQSGTPESPEERADRLALQGAHRAARWTRRLPVMYRDATLADLGPEQHAQAVRDWLPGASSSLVLAGPVGTGKTHAAYAVGNAAVAAGSWVEAWTMADLLAALRPGGDPADLDAVRGCSLLVLDDLGGVKVTDWSQEQFSSLMDHRLRSELRQVVTTNAAYPDLVEAWGDRALDRLRYRWTPLAFTGTSRRLAAW